MSNINNHRVDMNNKQIKDFYSIEAVQDLDHEAAATISGGGGIGLGLTLSYGRNHSSSGVVLSKTERNLRDFNNKASWYQVGGGRDWIVYTGQNFKGKSRRLKAGTKGNFTGPFNNNIESVKLV